MFALAFMVGGVLHFVNPRLYLSIMPPYIPWHAFWVYTSGVAELLLGGLLLVPQTQKFAAWGLIGLLLAVFPANLHMALHTEAYPTIPALALWLRLPLQAALIGWAYLYTKG